MIFWRIVDNQLYPVHETDNLGFEKSEGLRITDEYLGNQEFMVMRTCHGIGDWGIISAMPRLLKEKYPNCKVYVPSEKLLNSLFGQIQTNWTAWSNPFSNAKKIFDNNPYVDEFVDEIDGEVFHDHYRIYDKDNTDIPLIKQMLEFWQFTEEEMSDSQPEMYWLDEEKKLGDAVIKEHVGDKEFGCLLVSDRIGTQFGKYSEESYENEIKKIKDILLKNKLPYFYWTHKPLEDIPFNFINGVLDIRNMNLRVQLYIKSKAKINIGTQCGPMDITPRYSKTIISQRQSILGQNFVRGVKYI